MNSEQFFEQMRKELGLFFFTRSGGRHTVAARPRQSAGRRCNQYILLPTT